MRCQRSVIEPIPKIAAMIAVQIRRAKTAGVTSAAVPITIDFNNISFDTFKQIYVYLETSQLKDPAGLRDAKRRRIELTQLLYLCEGADFLELDALFNLAVDQLLKHLQWEDVKGFDISLLEDKPNLLRDALYGVVANAQITKFGAPPEDQFIQWVRSVFEHQHQNAYTIGQQLVRFARDYTKWNNLGCMYHRHPPNVTCSSIRRDKERARIAQFPDHEEEEEDVV
jgi:hypothetical protein